MLDPLFADSEDLSLFEAAADEYVSRTTKVYAVPPGYDCFTIRYASPPYLNKVDTSPDDILEYENFESHKDPTTGLFEPILLPDGTYIILRQPE